MYSGELVQPDDIFVRAKADLHPGEPGVSGLTGEGIDWLISLIVDRLATRAQGAGLAIRARHESAMRSALLALKGAERRLEEGDRATDLAAEELRAAIRALDSLVGRIDVEAVLGEIFSSFCLGK
jgi:tRNA modification GTPase